MYQLPVGVRTDAWKPSGLRSAWIVAFGSSMPRPLNVAISGCFSWSPGAMMSDLPTQEALEAALRVGQRHDDARSSACSPARRRRGRRCEQLLEARLVELEPLRASLGVHVRPWRRRARRAASRRPRSRSPDPAPSAWPLLAPRRSPSRPARHPERAPPSRLRCACARTGFSPSTCCTFALISPSRSVCCVVGQGSRQFASLPGAPAFGR